MKKNQTLKADAYDVALFPMEYLKITQGRYTTGPKASHVGYNAYDLAGKDTGIDPMFAPFDLRVEWLDPNTKTGVVFSNAKPVLMANGNKQAPRTLLMMLWHSDTIRHLKVGQLIPQGREFYYEGTAGRAYGNHVHIELSYGTYSGYPLFQLPNKYWTLKGKELNIEDCFFVNDTKDLGNGGYKFKTYKVAKPITPKPPAKTKEYVYLDKSVKKWGFYKLNVYPKSENIFNYIYPERFGGLTYEILGKPYANTVTIQTRDYGKVNIWIGPKTPHKIIRK